MARPATALSRFRHRLLLTALLALTFAGTAGAAKPSLGLGASGPEVARLYAYLQLYGYFPNPDLAARYPGWQPAVAQAPKDPAVFDERLERALRLYQAAQGLPIDGRLNPATRLQIRKPRCGFPDYYGFTRNPAGLEGERRSRYQHVSYWRKSNLTFAFQNYTADLSVGQARNEVSAALGSWMAAAPVTFTEGGSSSDILIKWATGDHGNGHPFASNVLAHAFYPSCSSTYSCDSISGDLHFNDTYLFGLFGYSLRSVALHELGHSLGLGHSNDWLAAMYASYTGRTSLGIDDVVGIQTLYSNYYDPITFDTQFYLDRHDDLRAAFGINNFTAASRHWVDWGRNEGRDASPAFQVKDYLVLNPDLAAAFGTNYRAALQHWTAYGLNEGRQGSYLFSAKYYLSRYADVAAAFGPTNYRAALEHWLGPGLSQGRMGIHNFDPRYYLQANPVVASWCGGTTNYRCAVLYWQRQGRNEPWRGIP
jgi:peptidoglycan hydrolase-like protein with peptidoglycan-binding domain